MRPAAASRPSRAASPGCTTSPPARSGSTAGTSARCPAGDAPVRRDVQVIFQDPYGSLNPRRRVGSIIGDPFAIHGIGDPREQQAPGPGAHGAGRAEPGALQPVPRRVLRRPAAADRRGPGARAATQARHLRRAGLRARRLDPGPDHQPARRPAGRVRADLPLHLPRPVGGPARQRPDRRHVPGQDRRDRAGGRAVRARPGTRTPGPCCPRCPPPDPDTADSREQIVLVGDLPSPDRTRRRAAASTRGAPRPGRTAPTDRAGSLEPVLDDPPTTPPLPLTRCSRRGPLAAPEPEPSSPASHRARAAVEHRRDRRPRPRPTSTDVPRPPTEPQRRAPIEGRSPWLLAWHRLRRDRVAMVSLGRSSC